MTDHTSHMLAKSGKMRHFRNLEEAAELSHCEVRAGTPGRRRQARHEARPTSLTPEPDPS